MFEKLSLDKFAPPAFEVKEVGTIREIKRAVTTVVGLPSCLYGQMVHFPYGIKGMVMGFDEEQVAVLVFGDETQLRSGDTVVGKLEPFKTPVGEGFVGRVVDAVGRPRDGGATIEPSDVYPTFRVAHGVLERLPLADQLLTGTKVIDAVIPVAKGQRELIIGDRKTGKTVLGVDAILSQQGKDVISIYCVIGQSHASYLRTQTIFRERGAMDYTIVVAATAADSPGEQYLAPYTATALGEYLMHHGRDVLVVFDDLTKHAWAHRQISLIMGRSPGREAYPGDMFYTHSQLLERAGRLRPEFGGGTMTFLPIVEMQQGDVTGHIPSNLISITDGQIYLSADLFNEGFKPAVDLNLSVSRIGSKIQPEAMRELCGKLRLEYIQYREFLRYIMVQSGATAGAEARLRKGAAMTQVFTQDKHQPLSLEEEIVMFYTLRSKVLEDLDPQGWKRLKAGLSTFLRRMHPDLLKEVGTGKRLTDELMRRLDEAFRDFLRTQKPS